MKSRLKIKLLSIIGTRPQYIKIKPLYDYCNLKKIEHIIIDTNQHYSDNVSKDLINDLNLKIDINLNLSFKNEIEFISKATISMHNILREESPDFVLIYGDTNSTFCAALTAYKLKIPIVHIEAGERCFDNSVPEEINRIFADSVSLVNFCSSEKSTRNIGGIYSGDLEYNLLNNIDPKITFEDFGVMTIHRQNNCSKDRMLKIFNFCSKIPYNIKFFAHHRILDFIKNPPKNVHVLNPCTYSNMVKSMAACKFIITDSGSVQKTAPFFGKNTLVMRNFSEWKETEEYGFAKLESSIKEDLSWIMSKPKARAKNFYLKDTMPSELIINYLLKKESMH